MKHSKNIKSNVTPGSQLEIFKKEFPAHRKTYQLIKLTCKDCKLMYRRNAANTKHITNICLKKLVKRLKHEWKDRKRNTETQFSDN